MASLSSTNIKNSNNNIIANNKHTKDNDISKNELIRQRQKKLEQLYCVLRLTDFLDINNEDTLNNEINDFLNKNDIEKGLKFQSNTLPTSKQRLPPTINNNNHNKNLNISQQQRQLSNLNNNNNINNSNKFSSSSSLSSTSSSSISQLDTDTNKVTKSNNKRPLDNTNTDEDIRSKIRKKSLSYPQNAPPSSSDNSTFHSASPTPNEHQQNDLFKKMSQSHPTRPYNQSINYHNNNKLYSSDTTTLPPPITTPISNIGNFKLNLLSKLSTDTNLSDNNRNRNNDKKSMTNTMENLNYILLNETLPSKIAQSIPLTELRYLAHTLPLIKLLPMSHKVLTTDIINNALNEGRITVVSSRIEELKRSNLWSLRQPKKFFDPFSSMECHDKIMINEAIWLQNDFKESLNYKIAMSNYLANSVLDYWKFGKICCIKRKDINFLPIQSDSITDNTTTATSSEINLDKENEQQSDEKLNEHDNSDNISHKSNQDPLNPLTIDENDLKSIDTDLLLKKPEPSEEFIPPTLPETLEEDYQNYLLEKEKLLGNYYATMNNDTSNIFKYFINPHNKDSFNTIQINILDSLPIYKGIDENLKLKDDTSLPFDPISKSLVTLDDNHFLKLIEKQTFNDDTSLSQLNKKRGLFSNNSRIHYLRPPQAPSLKYLQFRTPTIWLPEDDEELVKNLNAYAYNWNLISTNLLHFKNPHYISNMERRTAWQCFERFIQLNEKFNLNDLKGPKSFSAQQWLIEAHKFQQKQNRRISPLGVNEESIQRGHRRLRWASMFDAMRKCIKKRENLPRPNPSQPRKPLDVKHLKVPTPAEMSQLKAQRDESIRRDLQLRRNAKNRLQQTQQQQQQQQLQNKQQPTNSQDKAANISNDLPNRNSVSNNTKKDLNMQQQNMNSGENSNISGSSDSNNKRSITSLDIIENFCEKIMARKPGISKSAAMKAAQTYYQNIRSQQERLQNHQLQQKQELQRNMKSQSPIQPKEEFETQIPSSSINNSSIDSNNNNVRPQQQMGDLVNSNSFSSSPVANNNNNNSKNNKSLTPAEILQRFQK